jgi:hypothetical protein
MNTNRKRGIVTLMAVGALSLGLMFACGCSETPSETFAVDRTTVNGLPTVIATGTLKADVTVDAIDYSDRSIALTGPNGVTHIFTAGPEVVNFDQIKKGDIVKVEYFTRLAVSVRKVGAPLAAGQVDALALAPVGAQPGVFATRTVTMNANVLSIDYGTRVVTLKPLSGDVVTFTVDPRVKDLDKVHVGDQVIFNYTEAVAIYVTSS